MIDQFKIPIKSKNIFNSISQFEIKQKIGKGAFSQVYLCIQKNTQNLYALKVIELDKISKNDFPNLSREILIHRSTNHNNITILYDYFQEQNKVYLVIEYCQNGNLFQEIYSNKKLSLMKIQSYIRQLIKALMYLHSLNLIHRDLKPENLLLDQNSERLAICDFGWACHLQDYSWLKIRAGTKQYMAPEVLCNQNQSQKTDVWAIGILLYEMLYQDEPFKGDNFEDIYNSIKQGLKFKSDKQIPKSAKILIENILQFNQDQRPSLQQILNFQFLNTDFSNQQKEQQLQTQIKQQSNQDDYQKRKYSKSFSTYKLQNGIKQNTKLKNQVTLQNNYQKSKILINKFQNDFKPKIDNQSDNKYQIYSSNTSQRLIKLSQIPLNNFQNIYQSQNNNKINQITINSEQRNLDQQPVLKRQKSSSLWVNNNFDKKPLIPKYEANTNSIYNNKFNFMKKKPNFENKKLQKILNSQTYSTPQKIQPKISYSQKKNYYPIQSRNQSQQRVIKSTQNRKFITRIQPQNFNFSKSFQRGLQQPSNQKIFQNNNFKSNLNQMNIHQPVDREFYIKRSLRVFSKSPPKLSSLNTSIFNNTINFQLNYNVKKADIFCNNFFNKQYLYIIYIVISDQF